MSKLTLLIDFDATLAEYREWRGPEVVGAPLDKARHAMYILAKDYKLIIFSTRAADPLGRMAIEEWLVRHGMPHMKVTDKKEPAHLTIDDRAITFGGVWDDALIQRIREFQPWYKTPTASAEPPTVPQSGQASHPTVQQPQQSCCAPELKPPAASQGR